MEKKLNSFNSFETWRKLNREVYLVMDLQLTPKIKCFITQFIQALKRIKEKREFQSVKYSIMEMYHHHLLFRFTPNLPEHNLRVKRKESHVNGVLLFIVIAIA